MPPPKSQNADDDDWETDPDFVNNQTEEEQRRGGAAKKDVGTVDMQEIKESVLRQEAEKSKAKYVLLHNPAFTALMNQISKLLLLSKC